MLPPGSLGTVPYGLWLVAAGIISSVFSMGLLLLAGARLARVRRHEGEDVALHFSPLPELAAVAAAFLPPVVFQASWRTSLTVITDAIAGRELSSKVSLLSSGVAGLLDGCALFSVLSILPALALPLALCLSVAAHWRAGSKLAYAAAPVALVLGLALGVLAASVPVLALGWCSSMLDTFRALGAADPGQRVAVLEQGLADAGAAARSWLPLAAQAFGVAAGFTSLAFIRAQVPPALRRMLIVFGLAVAGASYWAVRPYTEERALSLPQGRVDWGTVTAATPDLLGPEAPPPSPVAVVALSTSGASIDGRALEPAMFGEQLKQAIEVRTAIGRPESSPVAAIRVAPAVTSARVGTATGALARAGFARAAFVFERVTQQERPILGPIVVVESSAAEVELGPPPPEVTPLSFGEKRDELALLARGASVLLRVPPEVRFDALAPFLIEARSRWFRVFLGRAGAGKALTDRSSATQNPAQGP